MGWGWKGINQLDAVYEVLEDRRTIESHAGVTVLYNYGALRSSKCYHCIMWYCTAVTDDTSAVSTPAGLYGVSDTLMHHPTQPLGSSSAALNSDIRLRYYTLSVTLYPVYPGMYIPGNNIKIMS